MKQEFMEIKETFVEQVLFDFENLARAEAELARTITPTSSPLTHFQR